MEELLRVDPEDWEEDLADSREFFNKFGGRLPRELREEHEKLTRRLEGVPGTASSGVAR
jgi:phosphoenolpyruvate carboxykinase (GTP)